MVLHRRAVVSPTLLIGKPHGDLLEACPVVCDDHHGPGDVPHHVGAQSDTARTAVEGLVRSADAAYHCPVLLQSVTVKAVRHD